VARGLSSILSTPEPAITSPSYGATYRRCRKDLCRARSNQPTVGPRPSCTRHPHVYACKSHSASKCARWNSPGSLSEHSTTQRQVALGSHPPFTCVFEAPVSSAENVTSSTCTIEVPSCSNPIHLVLFRIFRRLPLSKSILPAGLLGWPKTIVDLLENTSRLLRRLLLAATLTTVKTTALSVALTSHAAARTTSHLADEACHAASC